MKTKEEVFSWLIKQPYFRLYCDAFTKAHPSESIEMFLSRMERGHVPQEEWFSISTNDSLNLQGYESFYLKFISTPNRRERLVRFNAIFWFVLAIALMVSCVFVWDNYTFISFIASLILYGGGCFVIGTQVHEYIMNHSNKN